MCFPSSPVLTVCLCCPLTLSHIELTTLKGINSCTCIFIYSASLSLHPKKIFKRKIDNYTTELDEMRKELWLWAPMLHALTFLWGVRFVFQCCVVVAVSSLCWLKPGVYVTHLHWPLASNSCSFYTTVDYCTSCPKLVYTIEKVVHITFAW